MYLAFFRAGSRILEWGHWGHTFKWGTHTGHILIITVDPYIRVTLNFQLMLSFMLHTAVPRVLSDCMHWSLKQSQIQYQHQKIQDKD